MKKFMAKTTALAMAAAMLLAGCGGNSAPQGDGEQANCDWHFPVWAACVPGQLPGRFPARAGGKRPCGGRGLQD